jgi:hypothetical protein
MVRKTRSRKTHRSKSHKRRHSRKHTRKSRGGACPCSMRSQMGGRGGLGGAELGHAYTTGASQELYQMTGRTPGLSSGGGKGSAAANNAAVANGNMGNVILPGTNNPYLKNLRKPNNNMGEVIVAANVNYVPKLNNLRRKTKKNN